MDVNPNEHLIVDTALVDPNPVLFCSQDGSPITFHLETGKNERRTIKALRKVLPSHGGKYIEEYGSMTPHTVLLVTDEGFKKRKYSRPAVCVTFVGDCIFDKALLDINEYLHPWEDKEKWKSLDLFDVVYRFTEKFPMFETPMKRKSQDSRHSTTPRSLMTTVSLLSPLSTQGSSLEKIRCQRSPGLSPVLAKPLDPDEVPTQDPADVSVEASPGKPPVAELDLDAVTTRIKAKSRAVRSTLLLEKVPDGAANTSNPDDEQILGNPLTLESDKKLPEFESAVDKASDDQAFKNPKTKVCNEVLPDKETTSSTSVSSPKDPAAHPKSPKGPHRNRPVSKPPLKVLVGTSASAASQKSNEGLSPRASSPQLTSDGCDPDESLPPDLPKRGRGFQDRYRKWEQLRILQYLMEHGKYRNLKGVTVWKEMAKKKILPNRSWQSLKNQFLKTILKNLHNFLSEEEREKFLHPPEESSDDDSGSFFYAGDYNRRRGVTLGGTQEPQGRSQNVRNPPNNKENHGANPD